MPRRKTDDPELEAVAAAILSDDPTGARTARVLRETTDQLYDGLRTGRYRWDQLYKTEKTHCGTLVEINLQREFHFSDGETLDYRITGIEVDCKYSQRLNGWMIPPEATGHICLLVWSEDTATPTWSFGLVRASEEFLNAGANRDGKRTLNKAGRESIKWLWENAELTPNVLLQLERETVDSIMGMKHGTERVNELFRRALGRIVARGVVATVAQQDDYMKRVRSNGGARTALKPEGILILGQFASHGAIAEAFGLPKPGKGESVSVRVIPALGCGRGVAEIEGSHWKIAKITDPAAIAPELPKI